VPLIVLAAAVAFFPALGGKMPERAARQPQRLEGRFSGSAREPAGPQSPADRLAELADLSGQGALGAAGAGQGKARVLT
jgi:hypothetical protein